MNSFGIGGSNAHVRSDACSRQYKRLTVQVILESASLHGIEKPQGNVTEDDSRLHLILLSAKNDLSLQDSVNKHAKYLEEHGRARLHDLAYTLSTRRDHLEQRTFAICDGKEPMLAQASVRTTNYTKTLVFVFTGQGAQWPEMGKQLISDFSSVRNDIAEMNEILSRCHTPPEWNILGALILSVQA